MSSDVFFIRGWLALFMAALALSGVTAVPLVELTGLLNQWTAGVGGSLHAWAHQTAQAVEHVRDSYPFLLYGTDWLAFAHLAIAVAFIGPWRDPIRNRWVVEWGLWCCLLVLPVAFLWAPVRGVHLFWRFVDASFGVLGAVPLWIILRRIRRMDPRMTTASTC